MQGWWVMDEDVISKLLSRKSLRIIRFLVNNDYATLRILEKSLKMNGITVRTYIDLLRKYDIVKVSRVGRAYVIMLNREGKTTKAVIEFLKEVGYL
jgi:predicted transcriptional regulator